MMKYDQLRNIVTQLTWRRVSQDSDNSIFDGKLLEEEKLDNADFRAEIEVLGSMAETRKALAKWKMMAVLSTTLLLFVSLSWIAREFGGARIVLVPPILSTTGGKIEFPSSDAPNVFSPASVASEWEAVVFHNNFHEDRTPYQGPPTDEVDKAWESLYKNIGVIKIPKAEAEMLPNHTLPIPGEEDGYIVGIEVYHQLHCMDTIRQSVYPERYGGDTGMNEHQKAFYWIHLEHCIDNIRQVIMCYSDISTIPWKYHERVNGEFPDAHTTHVCRNFDVLSEWMKQPERNFPQEKYQARLDAYKAGKLETV